MTDNVHNVYLSSDDASRVLIDYDQKHTIEFDTHHTRRPMMTLWCSNASMPPVDVPSRALSPAQLQVIQNYLVPAETNVALTAYYHEPRVLVDVGDGNVIDVLGSGLTLPSRVRKAILCTLLAEAHDRANTVQVVTQNRKPH